MKKTASAASCAAALLLSTSSFAADVNVRIVNLTNGIWYTPFLVAAHTDSSSLFSTGMPASASLQAMAEGGDLGGLEADLTSIGATMVSNPAAGLLPPGMETDTDINTDGTANVRLSVVAMLLPTNDAFMGLNAVTIPIDPGVYTYDISAYDAGTEANDEIVNGGGAPGSPGIPADPGGNAGTGGTGAATADNNSTVHIHRNTLGDTDPGAGVSDLDSRVHRWLNPVARVIITVR